MHLIGYELKALIVLKDLRPYSNYTVYQAGLPSWRKPDRTSKDASPEKST